MNAQKKVATAPLNVHQRLSNARQKFHAMELKKTGKNTFAGYSYFELGDFLIPALKVFAECGIGTTPITFYDGVATMRIVNLDDPDDTIILQSPMGTAALKGCHEVQNIGAVETYQRRYLWVNALEIVEHDALDASPPVDAEQPKKAKADTITEAQLEELQLLFTHLSVPVADFLKVAQIKTLDALPASWFERAKAWVNDQAKAKRAADLDDEIPNFDGEK